MSGSTRKEIHHLCNISLQQVYIQYSAEFLKWLHVPANACRSFHELSGPYTNISTPPLVRRDLREPSRFVEALRLHLNDDLWMRRSHLFLMTGGRITAPRHPGPFQDALRLH